MQIKTLISDFHLIFHVCYVKIIWSNFLKRGIIMHISLDKTIRAISIALDLADRNITDDKDLIENISNVNYSKNSFLNHSTQTTYIALEIAKILNIRKNSLHKLYISTLIHDIGAVNSLDEAHNSSGFIKSHCINGSSIISDFPIFNDLSSIILHHHENWDGSGCMKLKGNNIPIESQIIRIADLISVQFNENSPSYAQKEGLINWVKSNSGKLFSKEITEAFLIISSKDFFWFNIENISYMNFILDKISPNLDIYLNLDQFEAIANVFANIIDKKSTFTAKHSRGIAKLAYKVSKHIGYSEEKSKKMKIAGLLHDIGKLATPSSILNKTGPLTDEEFCIIKSHAYYTKMILDKIENIPDISDWASNHHEKLNGNGYPRGLTSLELSEESRILCVCDIYQALTEERPYRKGLSNEKAFEILDSMACDGFICKIAVEYLKGAVKSINTFQLSNCKLTLYS